MLKQRSQRLARKKRSKRIRLVLGSGLVLIMLGSLGLFFLGNRQGFFVWRRQTLQEQQEQSTAILSSLSQSPQQRNSLLKEIAATKRSSLARNRARYLLAVDLLKQNQPQAALEYLHRLERDYPLLAPQILNKKAQAYQISRQPAKAKEIYLQLIDDYADSPTVAEALFWLSQTNLDYQQKLIEQFPHHPHTQTLIRQLLKKNPDQFDLLLLLAKYSSGKDLNPIRDRLVLEYSSELTPEDWEAIASGYWQEGEYRKAADAYTLARLTPRNLYRAAKGFHLNGNIPEARRAYRRLIREFHDARESGLAFLDLASISSADEALIYLDMVIAQFPERAARALLAKASIYNRLEQTESANRARQKSLQEYPNSEAVAQYRWQMAQKLAARGNIAEAWQWSQPIAANNYFQLEFAPKAVFWAGKWATQLGKVEEARAAFKQVITFYPQSYYAWRSAIFLGLDVDDFNSLSQVKPTMEFPLYLSLPTGSDALKELVLLAQYEEAWMLLRSEIANPQELTVSEQFTEGLLLIKLGKTYAGIQQIWNLTQRNEPQEQKEWEWLRQTSAYWYGLFPFPYQDAILNYARQHQINPLLVISVMRKESSFAPEIDSRAGAIGLMQVVPQTAQWVAEQINLADYSLTKPDDNINIGSWYLAYLHDRQQYNTNSLLAIASYNAGMGNVNRWMKTYSIDDPDLFVEKIPFPETKDYVEGVFSNYWNYLRLYNPEINRLVSRYRSSFLMTNDQ
ncbi:transglycosylase SLT domain-containing protein [Pleurocapsales cyanobacterium LEGE 06147]|nr:transglycosylase SLT domain-containing protein [Pleurocapsales cyanobacterium LEGE 06147]